MSVHESFHDSRSQSCWRAGTWHAEQRSFHPGVLLCGLLPCFSAFLAGLSLAGKRSNVGVIMLSISAGLFRIWMTWEWAIFIRENRDLEGRPGGNTFRNTPKIHQLLGHFAIQTVSMVSMVVACAVAGAQLNGWSSGSSLRLSIAPVSHTQVLR